MLFDPYNEHCKTFFYKKQCQNCIFFFFVYPSGGFTGGYLCQFQTPQFLMATLLLTMLLVSFKGAFPSHTFMAYSSNLHSALCHSCYERSGGYACTFLSIHFYEHYENNQVHLLGYIQNSNTNKWNGGGGTPVLDKGVVPTDGTHTYHTVMAYPVDIPSICEMGLSI